MSLTFTAQLHAFVYDEVQIRRFAELINASKETHQLFVSVRPKYQSEQDKADDAKQIQNKHISPKIIYHVTPEQFVQQVRRFERPVGSYKDRGEKVIPTEMMVIYCTTNPRDPQKAAKKLAGEMMAAAFDDNSSYFTNLDARLTSCMMSSKGKTDLITIDIDDKAQYAEVRQFLREKGIAPIVVETRGGYHVMFHPCNEAGEVFQRFSKIHHMGDIFCPVPGTYQGGFPVRFIDD